MDVAKARFHEWQGSELLPAEPPQLANDTVDHKASSSGVRRRPGESARDEAAHPGGDSNGDAGVRVRP